MSRVQKVLILSFGFLLVPLFGYAQVTPPKSISQFIYELAEGEVADDALVIPNETAFPKTVSVYVTEVIGTQGSSFMYAGEKDPSVHIGSWIRFYSTLPPTPLEQIDGALVQESPVRISRLCSALKFGDLRKQEREQKVVLALNRPLRPSEIQYLAELTEWCKGQQRVELEVSPFENKRLPFIIKIPHEVPQGEYRGGFFINDRSGVSFPFLAASIVEKLPGTRVGSLVIRHFDSTYDFGSNQYRFEVVVANEGGSSVKRDVAVTIESQFPRRNDIVMNQAVAMFAGEERILQFEWRKPMFGFFAVRADVFPSEVLNDREQNSNLISQQKDARGVSPWSFTFLFIPPLSLLIIVVFLGLISLVVCLKRYWRRRWLSTITLSWRRVVCAKTAFLTHIAQEYRVQPSLMALINGVPKTYRFHFGEEMLIPGGSVEVKQRDGGGHVRKRMLNDRPPKKIMKKKSG